MILSSKYGIQVRAGCSCAGPYGHDLLGLTDNQEFEQKPGWVRVSLHFTHSKEDIDKLLEALKSIAAV
jgi:selenocysteine lyase/cysteine desulfurase